jgi:hypothetical protein
MKLLRLIKMCLNETYNRVGIGKNVSVIFHIRNNSTKGDVLTQFLFNYYLDYEIRRVQVNQNGLILNGTHQFLVYADDVNEFGRKRLYYKEKRRSSDSG